MRIQRFTLLASLLWLSGCACPRPPALDHALLLTPGAPEMNQHAPHIFKVRLDTTKGAVLLEVHRSWAPHGADRFYNLVRAGYYDESRFFRVIAGKWAQFGINPNPKISMLWRAAMFPDDPSKKSNARGTIAFAFAYADTRTTQVFINLRDNSLTHDPDHFVPFGKVIQGMDVADALFSQYAETSGSGIRASKQDPLFLLGNAYLDARFPKLDGILSATIVP